MHQRPIRSRWSLRRGGGPVMGCYLRFAQSAWIDCQIIEKSRERPGNGLIIRPDP